MTNVQKDSSSPKKDKQTGFSSTKQDIAMFRKGVKLEELYGGYFGSKENCEFFVLHIPTRMFSLKNPKILDAGSSYGTLGGYIEGKFIEHGSSPHLILLDLNGSALSDSPVRAEKIVSDLKDIDIKDSSIDLVLLRSVLHYEPSIGAQEQILKEIYRILSPHGVLISQFASFPNSRGASAFNDLFHFFGRDVRFVSKDAGVELHKSIFPKIIKISAGPSLSENMNEFASRLGMGGIAEVDKYISEHIEDLRGVLINPEPPYAWRLSFTIVSCEK